MSVADLTGRLKEAEEAFKEAPTSLQMDEKMYLTEEECNVRRKKREAENHSDSGTRGGGTCKGRGRDRGRGCGGSSSSGSSSKPIGDEYRCCDKLGIRRASAARSPRRSRCTPRKMRRTYHSCSRWQP
jgi:hypothetical protein